MDLQCRLIDLLGDPREDITVEIEDWLEFAEERVVSDFASEADPLSAPVGFAIPGVAKFT